MLSSPFSISIINNYLTNGELPVRVKVADKLWHKEAGAADAEGN